jgi:Nucleotidyl transferase AbiEii toxin, Type IV TA system
MTARELYDLSLRGGGNDFQATVELLDRLDARWCLIGGLAINVYCEPVYSIDIDFVVIADQLERVCVELAKLGFAISHRRFWVNAHPQSSSVIIQFATSARCQDFLDRTTQAEILDVPCQVAGLPDIFRDKLLAANDPERRPSKRSKDELDLIRIAEKYPEYLNLLPASLRARL